MKASRSRTRRPPGSGALRRRSSTAAGHNVTHVKAHGDSSPPLPARRLTRAGIASAMQGGSIQISLFVSGQFETCAAGENANLPMAHECSPYVAYGTNGQPVSRLSPGAVLHDAKSRRPRGAHCSGCAVVFGDRQGDEDAHRTVLHTGDHPAAVDLALAFSATLEGMPWIDVRAVQARGLTLYVRSSQQGGGFRRACRHHIVSACKPPPSTAAPRLPAWN